MLRFVALRGQHVGAKRYATDALRSCRGGSVVRAQETHGYGSAIMALLTYYLPLRSSARTRRRAACITPPRGDCPRFLATVGKTPVTVRRIDDLIARGQSSGFLPFAPTGRKVIAQGNALWVRTSQ